MSNKIDERIEMTLNSLRRRGIEARFAENRLPEPLTKTI